jgi:hypothetical protein
LPSPYQYPWVNFNLTPTSGIDSTNTLVFGSPNHCIVDSIFVCNTTDQEIFIDVTVLAERVVDEPTTTYIVKNYLLRKSEGVELIKESVINMEAGDLMYAKSDFADNTFDCMVSHRQLLEE